jgi:hypothetical protein
LTEEDPAFPHPWGFLGKTYKEQQPQQGDASFSLIRRDTFLWNGSSNPTAWRDPFDDQGSSYSSSISRPSSPSTLSSYRGTPSLSDLDHHSIDDLASQMETDIPLFNAIDRNETVRPRALEAAVAQALQGHRPPSAASSLQGSPQRQSFFDQNLMSSSPAQSPGPLQTDFSQQPAYTISYSQPPTPARADYRIPERKDSKLSKLNIPNDSEMQSEMGTATAGPDTARPGRPHVLEQLLNQASGVSPPSFPPSSPRD